MSQDMESSIEGQVAYFMQKTEGLLIRRCSPFGHHVINRAALLRSWIVNCKAVTWKTDELILNMFCDMMVEIAEDVLPRVEEIIQADDESIFSIRLKSPAHVNGRLRGLFYTAAEADKALQEMISAP